MKIFIATTLLLLLLNEIQSHDEASLFEEFIINFQKQYKNALHKAERFEQFKENLKIIEQLNIKSEGNTVYGVTQFSDLSAQQFKEQVLMPPKPAPVHSPEKYERPLTKIDLPQSFDWRDKGVVTEVKDQGTVGITNKFNQGSCWTFSTTGNLEGQWKLAGYDLISLSEEQIVDCDNSVDPSHKPYPYADCGVFGGWPYLAMEYIKRAGGLAADKDYPYCVGTGKDDACYPCNTEDCTESNCGRCLEPPTCNRDKYPCKAEKVQKTAQVEGWKALSQNEDELAQQLIEIGPLSVGLNADGLQHYHSGIFNPWGSCDPKALDHAVLMVGFGVQEKSFFHKEQNYWIIKNSWGTKWGEKGYFRIARGEGKCGINTQAITAIVKPKLSMVKE